LRFKAAARFFAYAARAMLLGNRARDRLLLRQVATRRVTLDGLKTSWARLWPS
jgi:hypothetical protein